MGFREVILSMYIGEPCRICGRDIIREDLEDGIRFAGYSDDNRSRAAHERCWKGMLEVAREVMKEKWREEIADIFAG